MQRTRYTPEQKAEALELLASVGLGEAARRTGIPSGTIGSWGHRNGVTAPAVEVTLAAATKLTASWAERRAAMGEEMGRVAAKALEKIQARIDEGDELAAQRLASTMAVLIDRAQLLTGEATQRVEQLGGGSAVEAARALLEDVRERRLKAVS